MHFFSVHALQRKILSNQLNEKSKFIVYFIITMFLVVITLFSRIGGSNDGLMVLSNLIYLLVSSIGLICCYWINAKQDNKNFIERITLVTLPLSIQMFLLAIAFAIIKFCISYFIYKVSIEQITNMTETSIYDLFMTQSLALYYFIRGYFFIKKVSKDTTIA